MRSAAGQSIRSRVAAVVEVLCAFAVVHVTYRTVKYFTAIGTIERGAGTNFTPGVVMILFTAGVLLLCGRSFVNYGLTVARWKEGLRLGMIWGLMLVGGGALLMFFRLQYRPGSGPPGWDDGIVFGLACLAAVALFAWLGRRQHAVLSRIPVGTCVALLVVVPCLPLLLAWFYQRPLLRTGLAVSWLVVGAGVGEEVFFRGYIQSRINEAFGRPFRVRSVEFGAGLLVSTVLFGFLHTLNTVDYFLGRFTFAWGFGVATLGTGLLFACLREATGSILAGVVTHGILDVLASVPKLIQ